MLKPVYSPSRLHHQDRPLSDEFGILCWNVHKETLDPVFRPYLHQLLHANPSNLLLLQEVKNSKKKPLDLHGLSYAMSPNMETIRHFYGVLTASDASYEEISGHLTQKRELRFATHKSLLITKHRLKSGRAVVVANVHAINFVPLKWFLSELRYIKGLLQKHTGALIVAGDFNNWTKRRRRLLERFCNDLGLEQAGLTDEHHVTHFFRQPIDHIFYRDLKLLEARALDSGKISDHNPIYARFSVE